MANPLRSPRFTDAQTATRFQQAMNNAPTIKKGESNRQAVRILQLALIDVGIPLPESIKKYGSPDGQFGNETRDGVRRFQELQFPDQAPDGKVGKNTLGRLDDLLPNMGAPLPPLSDALDDIEIEEAGRRLVLNVLDGPYTSRVRFVYRGQEVNFGSFQLVRQHVASGRIGIHYDPHVASTGLAVYCPDNSHATAPNCIVLPHVNIVTWKQWSVLLHECVHASQDIRGLPLHHSLSEGAAYIAQNLYHRMATGRRVPDSSPTANAVHAQADVFVMQILASGMSGAPEFSAEAIAEFDRVIGLAGYRGEPVPYDGIPR